MKYKVKNKEEIDLIDELLAIVIINDNTNSFISKNKEVTLGDYFKSFEIIDCDVQLIADCVIVTGSVKLSKGLIVENHLPITCFEIGNDVIRFYLDCSKYAFSNKLNAKIAVQLKIIT